MSKIALPKKGTYVSRSTYQKVVEENKSLKADIYQLVMKSLTWGAIQVRIKWQKKFEDDAVFVAAMKQAVKEYLDNHPEEKKSIESLGK